MDDLISRREALDVFGDVHPLDYNTIGYVNKIKGLPAVNQWIPCSERLPFAEYGESKTVLATC